MFRPALKSRFVTSLPQKVCVFSDIFGPRENQVNNFILQLSNNYKASLLWTRAHETKEAKSSLEPLF
jgi:hypothetical protein